jgi:TorA maturation chaperone TorD
VWIDEEGLVLQEPTFLVRQCYKRHGLAVHNWRKRPDDHLVVELHFIELLLARAQRPELEEIAQFMDEHLLRWLPNFAMRVSSRCETPFYAGAALLTLAYCEELRDVIAELLGKARPSAEEIEARPKPMRRVEVKPISTPYFPGKSPSW